MEQKVNLKIPFVKLVHDAMLKRGWNQERLAEESKVSKATVSRFFNKSKNVGIKNISNILNTLTLIRAESEKTNSTISIPEALQQTINDLKELEKLDPQTYYRFIGEIRSAWAEAKDQSQTGAGPPARKKAGR